MILLFLGPGHRRSDAEIPGHPPRPATGTDFGVLVRNARRRRRGGLIVLCEILDRAGTCIP